MDLNNSMDISNAGTNIRNDVNESNYNESNSDINSPKSNVTSFNRNKNRINKDIGVNILENKNVSMDIPKNKEISSKINNVNNEELIKS